MDCTAIRESLSAILDGEPPPLGAAATSAHLAACTECREWQLAAQDVVRRVRLTSVALDHDLSGGIANGLEPVRPVRRPNRFASQRGLLLIVAVAQLAITVPLLILGHAEEGGRHVAHELGSFDLALAVAFLVGALRPRLSGGLAWPCGIAAFGLLSTALIDVVMGAEPGIDEAQHLVAVAGALLLFWGARLYGSSPSEAIRPGREAAPAVRDPRVMAVSSPPVRTHNAA